MFTLKRVVSVSQMLMVFALLMLVCVVGCFTSAGARTKKIIHPDGTVEFQSDVSVIGTGDKTSQIAADGMFADGDPTTLGAGVKKASASQQSTGIGETLTGLGSLLKGLAELERAKAGGAAPAALAPLALPADTSSVEQAAPTVTAAEALAPVTEVVYSTDGYGGTPGPNGEGVYGRPSCGRCRAYHAAHPDVAIINLDDPANRAAMWKALAQPKFKFTGTVVNLPVEISLQGYTAPAK